MQQSAECGQPCAQMVAREGQVMANVHITPMRASRALALRYLATKFGVDMEALAVRQPSHPGLQWKGNNKRSPQALTSSTVVAHCAAGRTCPHALTRAVRSTRVVPLPVSRLLQVLLMACLLTSAWV